jgi:putative cell wall-binding protein
VRRPFAVPALVVALLLVATPPAARSAGPSRLAGASRFGTSVEVSRAGWPNGSARAYLASGRTFPDALAATALAAAVPGPILLTDPCALPAEVAGELRRLHPTEVVVVGGEGAVCSAVLADATAQTGAVPRRIAGPDRYATAAAITTEVAPKDTIYVASGEVFADSLAGGAAAAHDHAGLLLTAPCQLPPATNAAITLLQPKHLVLLGGEGAVCRDVEVAIRAAAPNAKVERIAGANRFDTAAAVADATFDGKIGAYIASGRAFPDALSAGPIAAATSAPVLLSEPCSVPNALRVTAERLDESRVTVVGGTAAVCSAVEASLGGHPLRFLPDYVALGASDVVTPAWHAEQEPQAGRGGAAQPDRIRLTNDVPGDGTKPPGPVLRVELRPYESAEGAEDGDVTDTGGYLANRAEVYDRIASRDTPPEAWPDPVGSTRWYGVDLYVPASFATDDSGLVWFSFMQWKGLEGGQPAIAMEIKRDHIDLGGASGRQELGPIKRGAWERLVVGVHFDPGAGGWVEVYRDGAQVLARTSRPTMGYVGSGGEQRVDPTYLKLGIYRSTKWQATHVLYFGPVSIGDTKEDVS